MPQTWSPAASGATRKTRHFSLDQLRLPLFSAVGHGGYWLKNTPATDEIRRRLQINVPNGSCLEVAAEMGCRPGRVRDELEGRLPLTVDVARRLLARVGEEKQRRRTLDRISRPLGFKNIADDDDSSVGIA